MHNFLIWKVADNAQGYCTSNKRKRIWSPWDRRGKVLLTMAVFKNKKGNLERSMVAYLLQTFGTLRKQKVSISHPSPADLTHWSILYRPSLFLKGKYQTVQAVVTLSSIPSCCSQPATSSTCSYQRVSPTLTFQQNHKALQICPLCLWQKCQWEWKIQSRTKNSAIQGQCRADTDHLLSFSPWSSLSTIHIFSFCIKTFFQFPLHYSK